MRQLILPFMLVFFAAASLSAQRPKTTVVDFEPDQWNEPRLNTAANATWMKPEEREMVYELNRLRSNPQRYIQYLKPYLEEAREDLKRYGKEEKGYSITTIYATGFDGKETVREDTNWHNRYEEEVLAIEDLINTLENLEPLSILQPDRGLYKAGQVHAADEARHGWDLGHRGSDGSWPWHRIKKYSSTMASGNENIAGKGRGGPANQVPPRDIVILLLIDSGIPSYGHRKNILNPEWTHVGVCYGGWHDGMHRWIQEFGVAKGG